MKKYVCIIVSLLLSACLPLMVLAEAAYAVSFRYDYASESFTDSDGNVYEKLDTYHYAVCADQYLGCWGDEFHLYSVKNCSDRRLLLAENSYGKAQLYCDSRYTDAVLAQLSAFFPGDTYGVADSYRYYDNIDSNMFVVNIDAALVETLYCSEQTVRIPYGDAVKNAQALQICVFSNDQVFYTPVGLLTEWEGTLHYADLRLLEGADFCYNGQPQIALGSTIQAVKLTTEQQKLFESYETTINDWYTDKYDNQLYGEENYSTAFPDAMLIVLCTLFLVLAPLAGMIVGVIVSVKSPDYRAFGVGLFILCILILAAFGMLVTFFL